MESRRSVLWERQEIAYLKMHYNHMNDEQIAEKLRRTPFGIKQKRLKLGLHVPKKVYVAKLLKKMQDLIHICETSQSKLRKDLAKEKLKELSGLNR